MVAASIASLELWEGIVANLAFSITSSSVLNKYPTGDTLIIAPFPALVPITLLVAHFVNPGEKVVLK